MKLLIIALALTRMLSQCQEYLKERQLKAEIRQSKIERIEDMREQIKYERANTMYYTLTAYTWTGNPMANGEYPYVGAIACNSLPLGTEVYIEGMGTYTVCDTGGMGDGVIDVYMDSYEECIEFGARYDVKVIVLEGSD